MLTSFTLRAFLALLMFIHLLAGVSALRNTISERRNSLADRQTQDETYITTNGMCGASNGNTVCGNWPAGGCCSTSGYCGDTVGHCGEGCQSGPCLTLVPTSDGSCGLSPRGIVTFCGNWPSGSCCSVSGNCGNDTAHCGVDCQFGSCLPIVATSSVPPASQTSTSPPTSTSSSSNITPVPSTVAEVGNHTFSIGDKVVSDLVAILNANCGPNGCDAGTPQQIQYSTATNNQLITSTFTITVTGNYGNADFKVAMINVIQNVLKNAITCSKTTYLEPFPCNAVTDRAGGCIHESLNGCDLPNYIQVTTYDQANGGDQMAQITMQAAEEEKDFNCGDFTENIGDSTGLFDVEGVEQILGVVKLICAVSGLNGG